MHNNIFRNSFEGPKDMLQIFQICIIRLARLYPTPLERKEQLYHTYLVSAMDHLSQTSQDLLNNQNPRDLLDQEQFRPLYWRDDNTSTEDITSSSSDTLINFNRMKRQRSITRHDITIEPHMKQLKIDTVWNNQYITEIRRHPITNTPFTVTIPNTHFFPKYLSKRLPLPEHLISSIYNLYLNQFDRQIITGEHLLLNKLRDVLQHRMDINFAGISISSHNSWFLSTYNIVDENPNSPHTDHA